jgi:ATP-dependent helicase/nuclease subunit B
MRSEIGLPPPERRIGQAAHDFAVAFAGPRVLVTRAEKRGGTPTVRSRWLQRIAALIGPAADKDWQARGARYLALARRLDDVPLAAVRRAARPAPRPPVADRPRSLSITEIETWVRDPYAIYARHVLRLDPLDPLGLAPDFALRGTLMHEALGRFIGDWRKPFDAAAEAALLALSETIFAPLAEFPDIHALWCRRFAGVARWFIGFEAAREAAIAGRHAELSGSLEIAAPGGPFKLRGRADRIDIRRDDAVEILDFKSGTPPSAPQVLTGFAPQLALEAAMVREGAFNLPDGSARFDGRTIAEIAWLALNKAERGSDPFKSAVKQDMTVEATVDRVFAEFRRLVEAFDDPERPYVSLARPMFIKRWEGPYDHLARIREWSEAEPDGDEE